MKTKKFKIEFCVEIKEEALKGLSEADAVQAAINIVEQVWDLGKDTDEADRANGSNVEDSYGFEAELVE